MSTNLGRSKPTTSIPYIGLVTIVLFIVQGSACAGSATGAPRATRGSGTPQVSGAPPVSTARPVSAEPQVIERGEGYQILAVDGDYVQSGMRFPETLGIFSRTQIIDYEEAKYGHSVNYHSPSGTVLSVYVYGSGGDLVAELATVEADIRASNQADFSVVIKDETTLLIGDKEVKVRYFIGEFSQSGMGTEGMIMSSGGYFIKYRVSAPIDQFVEETDAILTFVESLPLP